MIFFFYKKILPAEDILANFPTTFIITILIGIIYTWFKIQKTRMSIWWKINLTPTPISQPFSFLPVLVNTSREFLCVCLCVCVVGKGGCIQNFPPTNIAIISTLLCILLFNLIIELSVEVAYFFLLILKYFLIWI